MDALITVLLIILICIMIFVGQMILSGRPIRIEHIHREIIDQPKPDPKDVEAFNKQQEAINSVISTINKEMGVLTDEQDNKSESEQE